MYLFFSHQKSRREKGKGKARCVLFSRWVSFHADFTYSHWFQQTIRNVPFFFILSSEVAIRKETKTAQCVRSSRCVFLSRQFVFESSRCFQQTIRNVLLFTGSRGDKKGKEKPIECILSSRCFLFTPVCIWRHVSVNHYKLWWLSSGITKKKRRTVLMGVFCSSHTLINFIKFNEIYPLKCFK